MIAAAALTAAASACTDRKAKREFELTVDVGSLTADGMTVVTATKGIDDYAILVVREAPGRFRAFSSQCSHMGCPVNAPVRGVFTCPCHGSQYDLNGKVLKGPAEYPLAEYQVEDAGGGRVTVFLEEGKRS